LSNDSRIEILYGAKRSGKTHIAIYKFLEHIYHFKGQGHKFVLGGTTLDTIRDNVLDPMEQLIRSEIRPFHNRFEIYGNEVLVRPGKDADKWKTARGFTAYGAYLNEGTALDERFVQEVVSRCSGKGSKIFIDTNPENPTHFIKENYIDKGGTMLESGRININSFHFRLEDNTFLDPEYVESIKQSTPEGMYYERDILGLWVTAEGTIYGHNYNMRKHVIDEIPDDEFICEISYGLDWGYEHNGCIVVVATTNKGNLYIIDEVVAQHKLIDWWIEKGKELYQKYEKATFFCDTARPDNIIEFRHAGLLAQAGNKQVNAGIEYINKLFKMNRLFLIKNKTKRLQWELDNYIWSSNAHRDEPRKENDDACDAMRYNLYTRSLISGEIANIIKK